MNLGIDIAVFNVREEKGSPIFEEIFKSMLEK
jgi:hypothetical protein